MRHLLIVILFLPCLAATQEVQERSFTEQPLVKVQVKEFESPLFDGKLEVSISLPNNYQHTSKGYPVIYTLDGEFLLPSVINISKVRASRNLMPESIVVGLKTSGAFNRLSIAMPMKREANAENIIFANAKPKEFLIFLNKELMPYIDKHYRTVNHNTIIGMSPTGGLVLTDYFSSTPLFNAHLALASDPQLYTLDDKPLIKQFVQTAKENDNSRLYLSRGKLDFKNSKDTSKQDAFNYIQHAINKHGLNKQLTVDIIDGGEHYGASLVSINNGFGFIYPDNVWRPDYISIRTKANPVEELQEFYQDLSKQYGFTAYPVVDGFWMGLSIAGTVRYLLRSDKYSQAIALLKWALIDQPKNVTLHYYLTAVYEEDKQIGKANKSVNQLVKLAEKQHHKSLSFYQKYQAELLSVKE